MDNIWDFASRINPGPGDHKREPLVLGWFLNWDSISDDYVPSEISAHDLFASWLKKVSGGGDDLKISWWIPSLGELAPFTDEDTDFLSFYRWPVHSETGQRLNWLTLPVQDKGWNVNQNDKGGFIQEATGWKPSALQRTVHLPTLLRASGWNQ